MEPGLHIYLVNGNTLNRTLPRQKLLTAEDLPKKFKQGEGAVFPKFRENKYDFFDWSLPGANANLLDNLAHNVESKILGFIFLFDVCVMQLYLMILNTPLLIYILAITWVSQLKMVIYSCLSLSQLNMC